MCVCVWKGKMRKKKNKWKKWKKNSTFFKLLRNSMRVSQTLPLNSYVHFLIWTFWYFVNKQKQIVVSKVNFKYYWTSDYLEILDEKYNVNFQTFYYFFSCLTTVCIGVNGPLKYLDQEEQHTAIRWELLIQIITIQ